MISRRFVFISFVVVIFLSGCMDTLQNISPATSVVMNGQALTNAYYSYKMVKSLHDTQPIFNGCQYIEIVTNIAPREDEKAKVVIKAFQDNLIYIVQKDLETTESESKLCEKSPCPGKSIIVQFKETGYDENILQKVFMGSSLRGNLFFLEKETGTILALENLEGMSNYKDLLGMIHTSVSLKLLKGIQDSTKMQNSMNKINGFDPIKPEYKTLFTET